MGYRWYEANDVKPVFPFGYGLSYTTFEYDDLKVKKVHGNKGIVYPVLTYPSQSRTQVTLLVKKRHRST